MKTARKILLIVSIIVVALIDQLYAIVYCSKRVGFFWHLFDLLPDIAMIPLLIGLPLGVYFGLDELSWDVFVRATAVSCVALIGQGTAYGGHMHPHLPQRQRLSRFAADFPHLLAGCRSERRHGGDDNHAGSQSHSEIYYKKAV